MYASIGVGALAITATAFGSLPWAAIMLAVVVGIVCATVLVLSKMSRRAPRLDWGSFHLSFDGIDEAPDA